MGIFWGELCVNSEFFALFLLDFHSVFILKASDILTDYCARGRAALRIAGEHIKAYRDREIVVLYIKGWIFFRKNIVGTDKVGAMKKNKLKNTSGRNQKVATLLLCTALFCTVQRLIRSDEDLVDKISRRQDFITEEQVIWKWTISIAYFLPNIINNFTKDH